MRVFKSAWFARFSRKEQISDASLQEAVERAGKGLIDADLGGGVIKQRIARPGQGRSGGYRTLILLRQGERAFFMFGFAKSDMENISPDDLLTLREAATDLLNASDETIEALLAESRFVEVKQS